MKQVLIFLFALLIFITGCKKDDSPVTPNVQTEVFTLKTHDIKVIGPQYFNFATKDTTSDITKAWDISFEVVSRFEPVDATTWMKISDPVIRVGSNVTIARVDNSKLDSINSVPSNATFGTDIPAKAVIAKNWLDQAYNIKNNVYIVQVSSSKTIAFSLKSYDYNSTTHQIYNIKILFKELTPGVTQKLDSIIVPDSYTSDAYVSFAKTTVTNEVDADIYLKGTELWIGIGKKVFTVENKALSEVTSVPAGAAFQGDQLVSYVGMSWYDYSATHILTPKNYIYIVRTATKTAAFKIKSYYNDYAKSGTFTIDWKYLQ